MMFDLREGQELDPVMINHFMETFNINIMVRPKTKENTKSVLVRGAEKDSKILFKVRKEILGIDEETSPCRTSPQTCCQPDVITSMSQTLPYSKPVGHLQLHKPQVDVSGKGQPTDPTMSTADSINLLTNIIQQNPRIISLLNSLSSAFPPLSTNVPVVVHPPPVPNVVYRNNGLMNPVPPAPLGNYNSKGDVESWISHQDRGFPFPGIVLHPPNVYQKEHHLHADDGDSGIFLPSHNRFVNNGFESRSELSSQPESSASSTSSNDASEYKTRFLRKSSQSKEPPVNRDVHQLLTEYENKKVVATAVMQQPIGDGVRTPTQRWSGYGFSKSTPDFALRAKLASQNSGSTSEFLEAENSKVSSLTSAKTWNTDSISNAENKSDSPLEQVPSPFSLSNFWDNVPQQPIVNYNSIRNLKQLFSLLDLEKYNDLFLHHEIDFSTFLTLTDIDLQQLNISYGGRRKMLTAIAAIKEQRSGDWSLKNFHAAPGAERRAIFSRFSASNSVSDENLTDGL